jgi:DNA-binding FadR family transcriptional regulator
MDVPSSATKSSPFSTVRLTRAHEQIVEQLQYAILTGKLAAGTRLPSERAMMVQFQVSRPTIREALRVAENIGLISVRPGDPGGSKVLGTPSLGIARVFGSLLETGRTSALELLEMRVVLDSSAAALASAQPKRSLAGVSAALEAMRNTTQVSEFADSDVNFHEALVVASGNRLFHLFFQALNAPIRTLIENCFLASEPDSREETLRQHADIVNAIREGDARGAACAVRRHLSEFYLPILSAQDKQRLKAFLQAMES